jgi:hypothetical protein
MLTHTSTTGMSRPITRFALLTSFITLSIQNQISSLQTSQLTRLTARLFAKSELAVAMGGFFDQASSTRTVMPTQPTGSNIRDDVLAGIQTLPHL